MKNIFKTTLAVAAIAAVGMGAYKTYSSYVAANMPEDDLLLTENVLALSDPGFFDWLDSPEYAGEPAKKTTLFIIGQTIPQDATFLSTYEVCGITVGALYEVPCNACVDGCSFAHCWDIPDAC